MDQHRITVRSRALGDNVFVEVLDTGAGIPPALLPRIFEPSFTTNPAGHGSGRGLAICHNTVHALGGRIDVESAPGQGTRMRVVLPALHAPLAQPQVPSSPRSEPPVHEGRPRVLVVDDEPIVGAIAEAVLRREFDVVVVTSGAKALEILGQAECFDAIVCDVIMPDISGMDLYAWMERKRPELCARAVFMTGGAFTQRATAFVTMLGEGCIEKPFEPRLLLSKVRRIATR